MGKMSMAHFFGTFLFFSGYLLKVLCRWKRNTRNVQGFIWTWIDQGLGFNNSLFPLFTFDTLFNFIHIAIPIYVLIVQHPCYIPPNSIEPATSSFPCAACNASKHCSFVNPNCINLSIFSSHPKGTTGSPIPLLMCCCSWRLLLD